MKAKRVALAPSAPAMFILGAAALLLMGGCSEPDDHVSRSTGDGAFELLLHAEKNWVRPGDDLPIRVTVRSLGGPLQESLVDEVSFIVNNGSVTPRSLVVSLTGAADNPTEPDTEHSEWITFTASSSLSSEEQGEITAIFQDALVTLKIRIVPDPQSL